MWHFTTFFTAVQCRPPCCGVEALLPCPLPHHLACSSMEPAGASSELFTDNVVDMLEEMLADNPSCMLLCTSGTAVPAHADIFHWHPLCCVRCCSWTGLSRCASSAVQVICVHTSCCGTACCLRVVGAESCLSVVLTFLSAACMGLLCS